MKIDDWHHVVVDDSGLADNLSCVTQLDGYASPLAGNLLVLGNNDYGETTDVAFNIEDMARQLTILRPVLKPVFETFTGEGVFASRVAALEVHVIRRPPTVIDLQ